ncbi:DUF5994 family protein [Streptomyces sp. NPDC102360]|uniref:DUF5994 family protein n=1 Tax=Streptomyces sp. NPDC102360 TaxID=3366160 RepID=UPI003811FF13
MSPRSASPTPVQPGDPHSPYRYGTQLRGRIDPSAAVIRLLERLGLAYDVRRPTADRIADRRAWRRNHPPAQARYQETQMTTSLQPPLPSHPVLRLRLAPHGGIPRPIDGAWWPRSYDLLSELPRLLAGLPRAWGNITSATVNGSVWAAPPGRMLVANQVVRLHRSETTSGEHTIVLLAPGLGRWDLLVVPPDTTAEAAEPLMAAAADAHS